VKKIILQAFVILISFFSLWFVLSRIQWMELTNTETISPRIEEKLGDIYWSYFKRSSGEITNQFLTRSLDSLLSTICFYNNINKNYIKIHILDNDEVNAFALPNGHLIIYSGLLEASETQEELCGVLCHEIAHIQLKHVTKRLVKEFGLTMLISMTTNEQTNDIAQETAKVFSSSAFDRYQEKEADIKAVNYLSNSNIDPTALADFLHRLSLQESEGMKYLTWISTHPDTEIRVEYIVKHARNRNVENSPILNCDTWYKIKEIITKQEITHQ